jgi:caffeoyl-CoA O-methyltransferase
MKHITEQQIRHYAVEVGTRQSDVQKRLSDRTLTLPKGNMTTSPPAGQLLALLALTIGAKRAIEVGTYTGYSALAIASALSEGGRLVALDASEAWMSLARGFWRDAGVEDRIDLRLGVALLLLDALVTEEAFEFAYVDADKEHYDGYYERCLRLVRPGGLICFDNMFWGRSVADPEDDRPDTIALRRLNLKIRDDERVDMALVPLGDGMTFVRRRT